MKKFNTKMLVSLALLVAIEVVLSRFLSINAWNIRIGFSFVPIVICAIWYGAIPAGLVAVVADVIGAVLFPTGPFFPGFTLTAFLMGAVFGLFLHKSRTMPRILGAVIINQAILGLFLNTFWISFLYGSPYLPLLFTRAIQCAVLIVVQTITIKALGQVLNRVSIQRNEA